MNALRLLLIAVFALANAACVSHSIKKDVPAAESVEIRRPGADTVLIVAHEVSEDGEETSNTAATSTDPHSAQRALTASSPVVESDQAPTEATPESNRLTAAPTRAEQDATALYGQTQVRDPWERFNRRMYRFNSVADKTVARPLAVAYEKVTPDPVQNSVTQFFANLRSPGTAVNQALQGRPVRALQSLGRFAVNSTVGIAGLFDPASRIGIPKYREDFGQTLATWGWRNSRYLVLPLMGPRTVRDAVGIFGDQPLSPLGYVDKGMLSYGLTMLQMTDARARLLPMDAMRAQAADEYSLVRDAWTQRRNHQIDQDLRRHEN